MMPLCPFPSIHWLLLAALEESYVLNIHEHYIKQTYRNRFDLLGVNGRMSLTIPVQSQKGQKVMMKDILLEEGNWRKLHLRSIKSAYGRAAFFEYYMAEIELIFHSNQSSLVEFSIASLEFVQKHIQPLEFELSAEYIPFAQLSDEQKEITHFFEPSKLWPELRSYPQVFSDRFEFQSNLSVLDLLMNLGPRAVDYLLLIKSGEQVR